MIRTQVLPKVADTATMQAHNSPKDRKVSYSTENMLVHILQRSMVVFLCCTDASYANNMAFKYLEKVASSFLAFFRDASHRQPQVCQSFCRQLRQEGDFFNSADADKLKRIHRDIDAVKGVMVENIDTIIARGDKIDSLLEKTNLLLGESASFVNNSATLRRSMCFKNAKLLAIVIFLVVLVVTVIVLISCQGFKKGNRCS